MLTTQAKPSPLESALLRGLLPLSNIVDRVLARHPVRKPKRIRKERRTEPVGKTA
jgi:hypothetical protein